jgi:SAM-dependent methyltransferase
MADQSNTLIVLNEIHQRLATITTVDEAKKIRDQAEAIRSYAKKVQAGLAVQNRAAAIKLLAERRLGELLAKTVRHRGGKASIDLHDGSQLPKNISWVQSHRWQAIAQVPDVEILRREAAHSGATPPKELTSREIYTMVLAQRREDANAVQLSEQVRLDAEALGIHHGDFRELAPRVLPDNSVQLVLTDPPYNEDAIPLFEAAAKEAARVLRPGGSFIAYSGHKHVAQAIMVCTQHLTYWWLLALVHGGSAGLLQKLGIRAQWKPLIWFVKNTRGDVSAIIPDVIHGAGREKDSHELQQGEAEAAHLIEALTQPGDLVVDFMAGSGTIPAAAKRLDRRIVAFERQADHVETIMGRLA